LLPIWWDENDTIKTTSGGLPKFSIEALSMVIDALSKLVVIVLVAQVGGLQ
jgi:hypothetical protein